MKITKANPNFNHFYAAGKIKIPAGEARDYVNYLIVKEGFAFRTDTGILIKFKTDLEDGAYQISKVTKTAVELLKLDIDADTPDYDAVLNIDDKYPVEIQFSDFPETVLINLNILFEVIIQKKYLEIAELITDQYMAYGADEKKPVILAAPDCQIALMPIFEGE